MASAVNRFTSFTVSDILKRQEGCKNSVSSLKPDENLPSEPSTVSTKRKTTNHEEEMSEHCPSDEKEDYLNTMETEGTIFISNLL